MAILLQWGDQEEQYILKNDWDSRVLEQKYTCLSTCKSYAGMHLSTSYNDIVQIEILGLPNFNIPRILIAPPQDPQIWNLDGWKR